MRRSVFAWIQAGCAAFLVLEAAALRPDDEVEDDVRQLAAQVHHLRQGRREGDLVSDSFLEIDEPPEANRSSFREPETKSEDAEQKTAAAHGAQKEVGQIPANPVKHAMPSTKINASKAQLAQLKNSHAGVTAPAAKNVGVETNQPNAEKAKEYVEVTNLTQSFKWFSLIACALAFLFELTHTRWSEVDWDRHDDILDAPADTRAAMMSLSLRGAGKFAYDYFSTDGIIYGSVCFAGVALLILVSTITGKKMNVITGIFWDALQDKDQSRFFHGLVCYIAMVPVAFLCWAYNSYITGMLSIHWRQSLTRKFQSMWLEHATFSIGQLRAPDEKRGVENPDQRIEEDIPNFVNIWTSLLFGLLSSIPVFFVWMPIVLELSPDHILAIKTLPRFRPWLLIAAITWCLGNSVISHLIGRNIITLTYARERYNADFRMGLARVRYNADAIAVLHAEHHEQRSLEGQFERIKRTFWEQLAISKRMSMVNFLLDQGGMLFPLITLGHAYFAGGVTLGHFMRIRVAVGMVQDSMSWFVNSYEDIAHFRAITNRLNEMMDHCDKVKQTHLLKPEVDSTMPHRGVKMLKAQGKLPTGTVLWNIEDLVIQEGSWTLVKGVEGSGKTTLMRILAGAWPVPEETRLIFSKAAELFDATSPDRPPDVASTPQPPEMLCVPVGAHTLRAQFRLKEAVCYPESEDRWTDSEVIEALRVVGLGKLLEEEKLVDAVIEGSGFQRPSLSESDESMARMKACLHGDSGDRTLSSGESQRLELAHTLLARPRWIFMDEPVSHIKETERAVIYGALREKLHGISTVVTITHDVTALSGLHDQQLEMRDGGLFKV